MPVVSVSRRTDIPAFYTDWFINRLHEGYVLYPLPWSDKLKYLKLSAETVNCFVFWSKDYSKLIPYLHLLDSKGYKYYFHFTINNYPDTLEKHVVQFKEALKQFYKLVEHTSCDHVLWRYDPIITTKDFNTNYHLYNFESIASELKGHTRKCYVEFVDLYRKVEINFDRQKFPYTPYTQDQKFQLVSKMATIAKKYDIDVYACCDDSLVKENVLKASCVDAKLIEKITGNIPTIKQAPTRKECGCFQSVDIGEYGSCLHGCLYCYATDNIATAQRFYHAHNPASPALSEKKLEKFENINLTSQTKINTGQLKLFDSSYD